MQKPLDTELLADLPENWQIDDTISPIGTDVGLTEKHGYNYQSKQINEARRAINTLNEAFENASESPERFGVVETVTDEDTLPVVQAAQNLKKRISFANIVKAIQAKFTEIFAAKQHSHGNITHDGRVGSTANQALMTDTGGTVKAGTLPVAGGGTGASSAEGARTNLGITLANLGAAASSHSHNASDINAGTLDSDRLPTVPVAKGGTGATDAATARTNLGITPANIDAAPSNHNHNASAINEGTLNEARLPIVPISKGGTGVTDLNVNKLLRGNSPDPRWVIYLSPSGNDNSTGLSAAAAMKTIRAAVGKYGGLNRLHLMLAPGTYTDTSTVEISGNSYVSIVGTSTTAGSVVIAHPIIFQSVDAKLQHLTFDLSASSETYPGVTLRQAKYDIQNCVFKGKATVHAGINVSLGSAGYIVSCTFQSGVRGVEIGSGASMTALTCSVATGFEIGFNVNGGMLISGSNTNNATTKFTMYNSAVIFNDGVMLNTIANPIAT